MDLASLVPLVLKVSIALTVFSLGLEASPEDASYLFRKPKLLFRALLSMNILMPLLAGVLVATMDFHPAVKIALVALSVSPVPPILPKKQLKEGAGTAYTFGLLVAAAVLAIIFIPITMEIFEKAFGMPAGMPPAAIAILVLQTVLAPLGAGILVRKLSPAFAARAAKPGALLGTILLSAGALPILFVAMPAVASLIGNGALLAIAAFCACGLAAGHLLGGPLSEDRTSLALSSASRHPGIAIAIAHTNFPNEKLASAAVLLYLIVNAVASLVYLRWRRRQVSVPNVTAADPGPRRRAVLRPE